MNAEPGVTDGALTVYGWASSLSGVGILGTLLLWVLLGLQGVAAVIDKDFGSSLLAQNVGAELFVISTAVEKVAINFGKPDQKWLDRMTLAEARQYLPEGTHFAKGSMAPKIEAIIWFLENGGKQALITNPENIGRALKGETGTWIVP